MTVSVYDNVGVSPTTLAQAEQRAAKIFNRAGLYVIWANCSVTTKDAGPGLPVWTGTPSSPGRNFPVEFEDSGLDPTQAVAASIAAPAGLASARPADRVGCDQFAWPLHLAVRIMQRSMRPVTEVFGVAFLSAEGTGCYSDVFYDKAMELHATWNVGLADILGSVMAHELGHLILGSNSHSPAGVMRAHWEHEELRQLAMGNLLFKSEQAERMRGKVIAARPAGQPDLAVTAQSRF